MAVDKHDSALSYKTGEGVIDVSSQPATIADVTVTGTYATDDTPIETAINSIIAVLKSHGLIADA